jgi:hypothetical protein
MCDLRRSVRYIILCLFPSDIFQKCTLFSSADTNNLKHTIKEPQHLLIISILEEPHDRVFVVVVPQIFGQTENQRFLQGIIDLFVLSPDLILFFLL